MLAAAMAVGLTGACKLPTGGDCTLVLLPAVVLTVVDSTTGASAAGGARVIGSRSGGESDTVQVIPGNDAVQLLFGDVPGTYSLSVTKAGYADWADAGVAVPASGCHPATQRIEARIQPAH